MEKVADQEAFTRDFGLAEIVFKFITERGVPLEMAMKSLDGKVSRFFCLHLDLLMEAHRMKSGNKFKPEIF